MADTPIEERVKQVVSLTRELRRPRSLEQLLQLMIDRATWVLRANRASVRLLDSTGTRLLATCRSGTPLHLDPMTEFELGEGLMGWVAQRAVPLRCADAEKDPRFAARPGLKGPVGSVVLAPLVAEGDCIGVLCAIHPEIDYFTEGDEDLLCLIAGICEPHIKSARLQRLTQVDPLTGALNRRGLDLAFPEVSVREGSEGAAPNMLCIAMADIDHFKSVNDIYGHAVGDKVLHVVTKVLRDTLRTGDAVIRYGGEEFLLVLPGVELYVASQIAERARETLAAQPIEIGNRRIEVTISLGVAERQQRESRAALIARADTAMYRAKKGGRNRVESAD